METVLTPERNDATVICAEMKKTITAWSPGGMNVHRSSKRRLGLQVKQPSSTSKQKRPAGRWPSGRKVTGA
jgi:hypothetical protein